MAERNTEREVDDGTAVEIKGTFFEQPAFVIQTQWAAVRTQSCPEQHEQTVGANLSVGNGAEIMRRLMMANMPDTCKDDLRDGAGFFVVVLELGVFYRATGHPDDDQPLSMNLLRSPISPILATSGPKARE